MTSKAYSSTSLFGLAGIYNKPFSLCARDSYILSCILFERVHVIISLFFPFSKIAKYEIRKRISQNTKFLRP